MMWEYFGIREDPFGAVPNPRFLHPTETQREALASLQYGFISNRGFTSLIAEPGLGKTTLLFSFLDRVRTTARTVFIFDTKCGPGELLAYILHDLEITPGPDRVSQHEQLHAVLLAEARAGKRVVVVIDEAQNLSPDALEAVRMLSNFETPSAKLIQIVLAGQPQLGDRLSSPEMAQLRQRISTVCHLKSFTRKETADYISHRLTVAGYRGSRLFASDAIEAIHNASHGIPRTINHLCFNAMSLCYALKRQEVGVDTVAEVVADQQFTTTRGGTEVIAGLEVTSSPKAARRRRTAVVRWAFTVGGLLMIFSLAVLDAYHTRAGAAPTDPRISTAPAAVPLEQLPSSSETKSEVPYLEVTVQPSQTIADIAKENLGSFSDRLFSEIKTLNPKLRNPDHIEVGQKLRIPKRESATNSTSQE